MLTERPMVADLQSCSDRGMDEPTIDCVVCGGPGKWEMQDQVLTDHLEWCIYWRVVLCEEHLTLHNAHLEIHSENYRMVLMPL